MNQFVCPPWVARESLVVLGHRMEMLGLVKMARELPDDKVLELAGAIGHALMDDDDSADE